MTQTKHRKLTQRLVRQALAISAQSNKEYTPAEDHLVDLIHQTLQRGSDQPILEALAQLEAQTADLAVQTLRFWADICASSDDNVVIGSRHDPSAISSVATIFLIPVVALAPPGLIWPATLPLDRATRYRITESFRRHQFIDAKPSLVLFPGWYTTDDLPTTWSGRRRWLNLGIQAFLHSQAKAAPPALPRTHGDPTPNPEPMLYLRWIVSVLIAADETPTPDWLDHNNPHIDPDAYAAWQSTLIEVLHPHFPETDWHIAPPGAWTLTIQRTMPAYHTSALTLQLLQPSSIPAVTLTAQSDGAWIIHWSTDAGPKAYRWSSVDTADDTLLSIIQALRQCNVSEITIHATPQ